MLSNQIQAGKDFYRNSSEWFGSQKINNGAEVTIPSMFWR